MLRPLLLFCSLFFIVSCGKDDQREKEIAGIPVEMEIQRFDERFARATADSLGELKKEFPYLFPRQYGDEVWIEKINDTIQQEINQEVEKEFSEFSGIRSELHSLFQHIKFYFPDLKIPTVITLTSEVDYRNKVVWTDDLLLISLDTYLGEDHHFYIGIQEYLKKNFEREQISVDASTAFAEHIMERPASRIFLANMIYYGKILYLKDVLLPFKSDAEKIGYTPEEMEWAEANEEQIWRYFVDKELLFNTDSELAPRFLYPAPFSKFYLQLDNEAPAVLGQYIGWQILRSYMNRNEVSLEQMLETKAETIFNNANYKPKKND